MSWLGKAPECGGKIVVLLPAKRLGDLAARCWLTCKAWGLFDRDVLVWL